MLLASWSDFELGWWEPIVVLIALYGICALLVLVIEFLVNRIPERRGQTDQPGTVPPEPDYEHNIDILLYGGDIDRRHEVFDTLLTKLEAGDIEQWEWCGAGVLSDRESGIPKEADFGLVADDPERLLPTITEVLTGFGVGDRTEVRVDGEMVWKRFGV